MIGNVRFLFRRDDLRRRSDGGTVHRAGVKSTVLCYPYMVSAPIERVTDKLTCVECMMLTVRPPGLRDACTGLVTHAPSSYPMRNHVGKTTCGLTFAWANLPEPRIYMDGPPDTAMRATFDEINCLACLANKEQR